MARGSNVPDDIRAAIRKEGRERARLQYEFDMIRIRLAELKEEEPRYGRQRAVPTPGYIRLQMELDDIRWKLKDVGRLAQIKKYGLSRTAIQYITYGRDT